MSDAATYEGMNLVDLLDLLAPVPEPVAISMWPQTTGWIWLGLALGIAAIWLGWRLLERHQAYAYRHAAHSALNLAKDDPNDIAAILRRTALAAYPRDEVAGLSGEMWLAFLDRSYGGKGFATQTGRAMVSAPYQKSTPVVRGLGDLAQQWVRGQKKQEQSK